ncbi:DUF1697-domain-containing protein [Rhizoclosmatium globosum]|uniref:DUF1697-domain-containing protein n=1 Tax=Rhizoclosmatium globosum TaxID=329046 RepID=A0A1Y2CPM6_9FUNG|nr:DUF1697-domain-containing protein [Rhizoclosmatium globosum]|eukprot:ORY48980.1 DUF1697-domain-containing protein [Rhizoclosmatium globosum]
MLSLPSIVLVCLLRGVNIGGSKPMKMATLSQLFTKLGFLNVKTYIQSGNVVFSRPESHAIPMSDLMKHIQENIDDEFGYSNLPLSIRTFEEIQSIVTGNPYLNRKGVDPKRLHVTFLASPMASSTIEAFPSELKADLDELITLKDTYSVTTSRREVYLHTPNGYARTKVENNAIEKALGIAATTRNWNTCNKLYEMMKL